MKILFLSSFSRNCDFFPLNSLGLKVQGFMAGALAGLSVKLPRALSEKALENASA